MPRIHRMDGDDGPPELVDATYRMALTSDTAGGFRGASAGSFLHVDAGGVAVGRFNLDPGTPVVRSQPSARLYW